MTINTHLGQNSPLSTHYAPKLLVPIPRQNKRHELGIDADSLPFYGYDIWNHYEVSWLNPRGKPQVALASIEIPATSPYIIESKSLKLYFNSLNNHRLDSVATVTALLTSDLSHACGSQIKLSLLPLAPTTALATLHNPHGICLDDLDIEVHDYQVNPRLLQANPEQITNESLYSNLLKSNCLVTQQPDWATLCLTYHGPAIDHSALLKYIISFRQHNEFHEQCVERMFCDISRQCQPQQLTISARFTRRGGIDINPLRSSHNNNCCANLRLIRQ